VKTCMKYLGLSRRLTYDFLSTVKMYYLIVALYEKIFKWWNEIYYTWSKIRLSKNVFPLSPILTLTLNLILILTLTLKQN